MHQTRKFLKISRKSRCNYQSNYLLYQLLQATLPRKLNLTKRYFLNQNNNNKNNDKIELSPKHTEILVQRNNHKIVIY